MARNFGFIPKIPKNLAPSRNDLVSAGMWGGTAAFGGLWLVQPWGWIKAMTVGDEEVEEEMASDDHGRGQPKPKAAETGEEMRDKQGDDDDSGDEEDSESADDSSKDERNESDDKGEQSKQGDDKQKESKASSNGKEEQRDSELSEERNRLEHIHIVKKGTTKGDSKAEDEFP